MLPPLLASALIAAGPALGAQDFGGWSFFLGDPHVHTGVSADGCSSDLGGGASCGALADVFTQAAESGLDWFAMTDHANGAQAADAETFAEAWALALDHDDEGTGLVVVPAVEWWLFAGDVELGHRNVFLFGDDADLEDLTLSDLQPLGDTGTDVGDCAVLEAALDELHTLAGDLLLVPHHPATSRPGPVDWTCHPAAWEVGVEVYSSWGNSLSASETYDPPSHEVVESGTVLHAMESLGLDLAFLGGTDSHSTRPGDLCYATAKPSTGGLTIAWMPAGDPFTRAALHDAWVAHRTYTTTGPFLPVVQEAEADGVLLGWMGDALEVPAGDDLLVSIRVPADDDPWVTDVSLRVDGSIVPCAHEAVGVWRCAFAAGSIPGWFHAEIAIDGEGWYGEDACALTDVADERVWGSPSFLSVVDHDDDGDGVTFLDGDCDDDDPSTFPGAPEIWYDGLDQGCDGGDDWDGDGDGVQADPWGEDCDDTSPSVRPGAADDWYDGVDADCAGNGDYDADADGWDARPWGEDCADRIADVHPGAVEVWYDGRDVDCSGGSDYDADVDGHDAEPWGDDCDDADPAVRPSAVETWYDGVDADCAGDDDFDADADGWTRADDCDDADPSAWPGAFGWTAACEPYEVVGLVPLDDGGGPDTAPGPGARACGCAAPARGPGSGLAPWLGLVGLLALRRRARAR